MILEINRKKTEAQIIPETESERTKNLLTLGFGGSEAAWKNKNKSTLETKIPPIYIFKNTLN